MCGLRKASKTRALKLCLEVRFLWGFLCICGTEESFGTPRFTESIPPALVPLRSGAYKPAARDRELSSESETSGLLKISLAE